MCGRFYTKKGGEAGKIIPQKAPACIYVYRSNHWHQMVINLCFWPSATADSFLSMAEPPTKSMGSLHHKHVCICVSWRATYIPNMVPRQTLVQVLGILLANLCKHAFIYFI